MSFTRFLQDDPLLTREQVMAELIRVADELNMPDKRGACVIAGMTISQEVGVKDNDPPFERRFWCPANRADPESFNYPHDSESNDGRSVGYFQQQKGPNGELWWGTTASEMNLHSAATQFMTRLKAAGYNASNAQAANDSAQAIQRSGVPQAYKQWWDDINRLYDKVKGSGGGPAPAPKPPQSGPWTGDPVWLADVLRAEGLNVVELPGWLDRGHGDMGRLWGVVCHHTGSDNTPSSEIAFHPSLGLCSQIHLARNGTVTLCGVGIAWHAGVGSYPGLPEDNANAVTIGIEAQNSGTYDGAPHRTNWPDAQYDAYVKCCAAICRRLGVRADHVISHKEWAGRKQGKWDPGAIDMNIFRADVQRRIDAHQPNGEDDFMAALSADEQREVLNLLRVLADRRFVSRSPFRHLGEGPSETVAGFGLNTDGLNHAQYTIALARLGDPTHLALLREVASADGDSRYPDRQYDAKLAKRVLAEINSAPAPSTPAPTAPTTPTEPSTPSEPSTPTSPVKAACALSAAGCVVAGAASGGGCALSTDGTGKCVVTAATDGGAA
ncbi:endolysin [Mycobacterium phage Mufasa]|uniref:N-acetylmuramoyl-L-alanine amidase n=2 Tax=root TaxID=1 RepID=A0A0M5M0S0_9CAUD|nr:endolysin [Mycobacterium phage Mufasa]ALF00463.1 lysin A, N-acetylmuramoyl-L-alanine amides domain [Mycobacterium phage Mufasa]